jgi:predicted SAM-dependent methyltransferase
MSDGQLLRVNLGCGTRYHADWRNYDLTPSGPGVHPANFIAGIPLPDGAASCVYHSHVLEHLPLELGQRFLAECLRVLTPGGILRVVVPDLEQSARDYLAVLAARREGRGSPADHRWMLLELFDQMVRTKPGGEWSEALAARLGNDSFVRPRLGAYGGRLMDEMRGPQPRRSRKHRAWKRALSMLPRRIGTTLDQVRYRHSGEIHLWMYDEVFLGDVLTEVGFVEPRRMTAQTSAIDDFAKFGLDVEPDGTPWKGVSLYMEARRPAS